MKELRKDQHGAGILPQPSALQATDVALKTIAKIIEGGHLSTQYRRNIAAHMASYELSEGFRSSRPDSGTGFANMDNSPQRREYRELIAGSPPRSHEAERLAFQSSSPLLTSLKHREKELPGDYRSTGDNSNSERTRRALSLFGSPASHRNSRHPAESSLLRLADGATANLDQMKRHGLHTILLTQGYGTSDLSAMRSAQQPMQYTVREDAQDANSHPSTANRYSGRIGSFPLIHESPLSRIAEIHHAARIIERILHAGEMSSNYIPPITLTSRLFGIVRDRTNLHRFEVDNPEIRRPAPEKQRSKAIGSIPSLISDANPEARNIMDLSGRRTKLRRSDRSVTTRYSPEAMNNPAEKNGFTINPTARIPSVTVNFTPTITLVSDAGQQNLDARILGALEGYGEEIVRIVNRELLTQRRALF